MQQHVLGFLGKKRKLVSEIAECVCVEPRFFEDRVKEASLRIGGIGLEQRMEVTVTTWRDGSQGLVVSFIPIVTSLAFPFFQFMCLIRVVSSFIHICMCKHLSTH